jgi:CheY-like chemotaxis protein
MDRVWFTAPWPALRVRRTADHVEAEPNPAARRWAQAHGVRAAQWEALAQAGTAPGAAAECEFQFGTAVLRCIRVPLPDGVLLWLHDQGEPEPMPQPPTAGLHVLCIEDNEVNLQLVRELLALRPAVRLRTAVDGGSGIAAGLAERPDLLLLDLQLPDISGLEVMRALRAAPSMAGCRYVALSANAMPADIDHLAEQLERKS